LLAAKSPQTDLFHKPRELFCTYFLIHFWGMHESQLFAADAGGRVGDGIGTYFDGSRYWVAAGASGG
jgi:hypothetical protein